MGREKKKINKYLRRTLLYRLPSQLLLEFYSYPKYIIIKEIFVCRSNLYIYIHTDAQRHTHIGKLFSFPCQLKSKWLWFELVENYSDQTDPSVELYDAEKRQPVVSLFFFKFFFPLINLFIYSSNQ